MLFDKTRRGVGEEGCMVAADVKSKNPGAAPSLRCEIECFKTRCLSPDPGLITHHILHLGEHGQTTVLPCSTSSSC